MKAGGKYMRRSRRRGILLLVIIAIFAVVMVNNKDTLFNNQENEAVVTITTLREIIDTSEMNTFQAVYNGIAKVMNEDEPGNIDFYVTYEAKVYAGFDFEKVEMIKDEELKKITVTVPEIEITDVNVDIASLDYMFQEDQADTSGVSQRAYSASIKDVEMRSEDTSEIYTLAKQNAENTLYALINPFVEQFDSSYVVEISHGGE